MAKVDVGWLWHRHLAHVNMRSLQSLLKGDHVCGLKKVSFAKDRACSACIKGKLHEMAHPPTIIIYSKRPLELLHLDLFGPPSFDSLGGRKYCLVIVDDYQDTLGYISSRGRVKLSRPSSTLQMKLNVNMMQRS